MSQPPTSLHTCSLTSQPIVQGVVSSKSGHLFEKQAIEKHLANFSYCPVTNQPLQTSDLIEITPTNNNVSKPQQSTRCYIERIQQEYDSLVLETHHLRKAFERTKEEIMHSTYQNEAAKRVIGKLLKENAAAELELQKVREMHQKMKVQ